MMRTSFSIVLVGFLMAACGGTTPPAETPESSVSSEPVAGSEPAAPTAWSDELSQADKAAFMKAHVVPGMGAVFQQADAARYADFGCKTCHGPDGKAPQAFLPKLEFKNGQLTCFAEKPELSKFMAEKVSVKMAEILGEKPFDPVTHEGFGCTGCHAISAAM